MTRNHSYAEAARQNIEALLADEAAMGQDFRTVGDDMAEYMVGAAALFEIPVPPEVIDRVRRTQESKVKARAHTQHIGRGVLRSFNPFG